MDMDMDMDTSAHGSLAAAASTFPSFDRAVSSPAAFHAPPPPEARFARQLSVAQPQADLSRRPQATAVLTGPLPPLQAAAFHLALPLGLPLPVGWASAALGPAAIPRSAVLEGLLQLGSAAGEARFELPLSSAEGPCRHVWVTVASAASAVALRGSPAVLRALAHAAVSHTAALARSTSELDAVACCNRLALRLLNAHRDAHRAWRSLCSHSTVELPEYLAIWHQALEEASTVGLHASVARNRMWPHPGLPVIPWRVAAPPGTSPCRLLGHCRPTASR
jgi:hypothetical protein